MRLKIKWNDDRVRGATTAILLLGRERLARGDTTDLVAASLAEYRADPEAYRERKRGWPDAAETGPLTKPAHVAHYRSLQAAIAQLMQRMTEGKRQFNSLLELDNYLIASLARVK
jgi:hypothetical protein